MPRQRAAKLRAEHTLGRVWLVSIMPELVPSPCIARGVDIPGSTLDCNMRGLGWLVAEPAMLWPFNHFRKPRVPSRGTIEGIYGMIVTQAREPLFYRDLGVPDTVNGRFDLLVLHLWMVLRRLKTIEGGAELSQALFDGFCDDMDANLREMGVGDLTVPKRMQAFGEAFYGRAAAYDQALTAGAEPLARALCKNILNGAEIEKARQLAFYAGAAIAALTGLDDATVQSGAWRFPSPARVGVQQ
jgi:cytochrome b pre-mRNA-processing protein 3